MDIERTVLYGLIGGGAVFVAIRFWFKVDTRFEELQRACAKLSGIMQKMGFQRIPEFLENLAIKDISGAFEAIGSLVKLFAGPGGPEAIATELREVSKRGLAEQLKTIEGRVEVRAALESSEKANIASVTAAAEAAGIVVKGKSS